MVQLKEVVGSVLLPLQLSLGIWQIMKLTPLWAVISCTMAYLATCFYLFARSFLNCCFSFLDTDCNKVKGFTCFSFLDTDYNKLKGFQGRVFKKVISHATTAGDVKKNKAPKKSTKERESENGGSVSVVYLGKKFELERKKGNKMLIKDGSAYYITDKMWETVLYIEKVARETVFVKDHKEIWEEVVTGDIMEFEEVLDSVILDNRAVIRLDQDYFLPVNLVKSEDKLVKILNLVGLFLQTQKHIHWLLPASLTFTSAVMGFSTRVRLSVDHVINKLFCRPFCRAVQLLCDRLPLPKRRWAYSWGSWVENLKPSNDLKSKIVSGSVLALVAAGAKVPFESLADCESLADRNNICVLVGGGVKAHLENVSDCESLADLVICAHRDNNIRALVAAGAKAKAQPETSVDSESFYKYKSCCKVGPFLFKCDSKCDSVYIEWIFDNVQRQCSLKAGRIASDQESLEARDIYIERDDNGCKLEDIKLFSGAFCCGRPSSLVADHFDTTSVDVECNSAEATKLLKFAFYMAKHKSGSLKSYDSKTNKVHVRKFVESVNAYVRSRYPPLYKLQMDDVVVR